MNTLVLVFATIKLMYFLRLDERYVMLVDLMFKVIGDIIPFLLFLNIFLIVISLLYRVTGVIVSGGEGDYTGLNTYFMFFVQIFRNAIGDEATPVTTFWTLKKEEGPKIVSFMVYTCWVIWIVSVLANCVILLNFLIAIISTSYDTVMTNESQVIYQGKCDIIFEITLLLDHYNNSKGLSNDAQIFTLMSPVEQVVQEVSGIVRPIKLHLDNFKLEVNNKVDEIKDKFAEMKKS